jgi:peptidyl-prolyl cis-trans isomerase SurA
MATMRFLFSLVLSVSISTPLWAQDLTRIAAVVNDHAITLDDLNSRIRLAEVASNIPDSPETRARLTQQVLHSLIDEQLQLQEAEHQKITVDDKDVDESFAKIAQQNKMTPEQFTDALVKEGVSVPAVKAQIKAQIAWVKVVEKVVRPRIDISDQEIDDAIARLKKNAGKPQYLTAEIFLAVDTPDQDETVKANADKLVDQLRHGGNFALAARQFSQSAGAANGGDLGWVQEGQLPAELQDPLSKLRPGEITDPIKGLGGYHILLLRDRGLVAGPEAKAVSLHLVQLVVAAKGSTPDALAAAGKQADSVVEDVVGCDAAKARAQAQNDGVSGDLGNVTAAQLPPAIVNAVETQPVGHFVKPLPTPKGYLLLMVCERNAPDELTLPSRDEIANRLGFERLDLQQRQYLRDLWASAYVDIRS